MKLPLIAIAVMASAGSSSAPAALVIEPGRNPEERVFSQRLHAALEHVRASPDAAVREVYRLANDTAVTITIRPITEDRATWHPDGDRTRGHTEADDGGRRGAGRSVPTRAIIYIPRDTVASTSTHWKDGLLVHELVHAIDLAYGRYNSDYTVRERRAVFIQNVWRERTGFPLRKAYHDRFPTLDYQYAKSQGALTEYARYVFTSAVFPPAPASKAVSATPRR